MPRTLCFAPPARPRRHIVSSALSLGLLTLIAASLTRAQSTPEYKPQGYVDDFANVLTQPTRDQLTTLCTEVDQTAHAQIAVVTVPTTNGQPIEEYSIDLATKWGVGPKQSNRGVLILFAVNDHKYWTQVGYGLEPILPDGKVGGFGREAIPLLRQGNYDGAILLMTRRVADVIAQDAGVTLSGQSPPPLRERPGEDHSAHALSLIFLALVVIGIIYAMSKGGGRSGHSGGGGSGWWIAPLIASNMGRRGWGGGGFGGFGGGGFGGGGAGGSW